MKKLTNFEYTTKACKIAISFYFLIRDNKYSTVEKLRT